MKTRLWVTEVQGVHWIVSSADDVSFWKTFIKQKLHKTILKVINCDNCVNVWLLYNACYCNVCKYPDVLSVQLSTQVFVLCLGVKRSLKYICSNILSANIPTPSTFLRVAFRWICGYLMHAFLSVTKMKTTRMKTDKKASEKFWNPIKSHHVYLYST